MKKKSYYLVIAESSKYVQGAFDRTKEGKKLAKDYINILKKTKKDKFIIV